MNLVDSPAWRALAAHAEASDRNICASFSQPMSIASAIFPERRMACCSIFRNNESPPKR
jgi:hypothetical protein